MNLYEINNEVDKAFENAIDPETGEIIDEDAYNAFNDLQMDFNTKVENILLMIKNRKAEAEAIADEMKSLSERRASLQSKIDSLSRYAEGALNGTAFETPRVKVSWRKSKTVEYDGDIFDLPEECLRYKTPEVDKKKLKAMLEDGEKIDGARIVTNTNMSIK